MSESLYKDDNDTDSSDEKHDMFDIVGSLFSRVHIWLALLIFILFVFLNTSFFVEDVLKKINGDFVSMDGNPTSNGIFAQGAILSVGYIFLDLLVSANML